MRTIGVSPMEALVLPRILAAVLMMPLLGVYSSVIAIIGGGVHRRPHARHPVRHLPHPDPGSGADLRRVGQPDQGAGVRADRRRSPGAIRGCRSRAIPSRSGCARPRRWCRRSSWSSCSTRSSRCSSARSAGDEHGQRSRGRRRRQLREEVLEEARDDIAVGFDGEYPIEIEGLRQQLRRAGDPREPLAQGQARRDPRRGRRLGHRQVGADALDHRAADPRRRRDPRVRRGHDRRRAERGSLGAQPLGRAVPGRGAVLDADGGRERRGAAQAVLSRARGRAAARDRAFQGDAQRAARRGGGEVSVRAVGRDEEARRARRARWRSIPSCCSSTSRPPGSTRSARPISTA